MAARLLSAHLHLAQLEESASAQRTREAGHTVVRVYCTVLFGGGGRRDVGSALRSYALTCAVAAAAEAIGATVAAAR